MSLHRLEVSGFRLLSNAAIELEPEATLIVGRNNSGKTSLAEILRRFVGDTSTATFKLEDFSSISHSLFCDALKAHNDKAAADDDIRSLLPSIGLSLWFKYDPKNTDIGPLSDFIVDLDPACCDVLVRARYELRDGALKAFFEGLPTVALTDETRKTFFASLRQRIPKLYAPHIWAEDPNDASNRKPLSAAALRSVMKVEFVNAQRGMDDTTSKDTDILAKVLEGLFTTAASPTATETDKQIAEALESAVEDVQTELNTGFNDELKKLLPTLNSFGYPGLDGPEMATETTLDVQRLLSNHTRVRYVGQDGLLFPEAYNGLGMRNLLFILLRVVSFYREYMAESSPPDTHLVFIEEPEAHLHPQMQEVFISNLSSIVDRLVAEDPNKRPWPVQFVVSTHSSHVANAARFEAIRYFLASHVSGAPGLRQTTVKDLRVGLNAIEATGRDFLHQYLTLTRCDLFFADKAVLVEGPSERILLPIMIRKTETANPGLPRLSSQYLTIMEVGGAYGHLFFPLLEFLELRSLIVTDLDSLGAKPEKGHRTKCPVHQGEVSSNATINAWFKDESPDEATKCSISELKEKSPTEKTQGHLRIAYQVAENANGPVGRTFEDAVMLANTDKFGISSGNHDQQENEAYELVKSLTKTEFALTHAIVDTSWEPPRYISEGLKWLAGSEMGEPDGVTTNTAADGGSDD